MIITQTIDLLFNNNMVNKDEVMKIAKGKYEYTNKIKFWLNKINKK